MYSAPLFDRIVNPEQITYEELVQSIEKELVYILGHRTGKLPETLSSNDVKKWECELVALIEEQEPRLRKVKIKILARMREKLHLEISGLLVFDNKPLVFILKE